MKYKLAIAMIIILTISSALVVSISVSSVWEEEKFSTDISSVQKIQDCTDVTKTVIEDIYDTCDREVKTEVCLVINENGTNSSCTTNVEIIEYQCVVDKREVQVTEKHCKQEKGFLVNDKVKVLTKDYKCTSEKTDIEIIMTCDSIYDGDGNGVCKSGESCMKLIINGERIEKYEKNSRHDYVRSDGSYILDRVTTEVLE